MRITIFCILSFFLISCAKNGSSQDNATPYEPIGARKFSVDDQKSTFVVSLFGVKMGTPDYDTVWSVIENANNNGLINQITLLSQPIEGGINHCIEVLDLNARRQITSDLQSAQTSLKESFYSVQSVDSCQ